MTEIISNEELRRNAAAFMSAHAPHKRTAWPNLEHDLTLEEEECAPAGSLLFSCCTDSSMANGLGVVHGGITAALVDTCMGITCAAHCARGPTPTITLTTNYARPVPLDARLQVRTHTVRIGATSGQLWSEVFLAGKPEEVLVTATGVFYIKR